MSSIARSVLGAAFLLTGASAAMAQSAYPPAGQPAQAGAYAAPAGQPAPAGAYATAPAPVVVSQAPKPTNIQDNSDLYGGHDPNSKQGTQAFWDNQSRLY